MNRYELLHGDCLEKLKELPDNSVDAVVTDPPSGIAFMGRDWDTDKGGRDQWIAWLSSIMAECLRVLKPGGHAFVWSLPRTSHWTARACEDAGFDVRDCVNHVFSTGFPKSHNISKALDKAAGAERTEVVGSGWHHGTGRGVAMVGNATESWGHPYQIGDSSKGAPITAPATDLARQWDGWGSALKPAQEMWWLCRKPLDGTIAANVIKWGVGGINIDGTRVATQDNLNGGAYSGGARPTSMLGGDMSSGVFAEGGGRLPPSEFRQPAGRWPSNLLFSHLPECRQVGTKRVKGGAGTHCSNRDEEGRCLGHKNAGRSTSGETFHGPNTADPDGMETVEAWECADGCPVAELDRQSGIAAAVKPRNGGFRPDAAQKGSIDFKRDNRATYPVVRGDSGGASRFFPVFRYQAKAPTKERKVDGIEARHPTQKPIQLMRWLVRLVTPPGGVVLDPFTGSGTTGVACMEEGFRFIGCEREDEYIAIARARIEHAANAGKGKQLSLLGDE